MRTVSLVLSHPGFLRSFPLAEWGACESGGRRDPFFLTLQLPGTLAGDLTSRSSSSPAEREPGLRDVKGCFPFGPDGCFL